MMLQTPPSAWYDHIAVERAVNNTPVGRPLSSAERRESVRILYRRGYSIQRIAELVHASWESTSALVRELEIHRVP
ncbi:hypothetical protein [Actinopolyspora halophila]|uniref:hypothetical protein n=1 Tax=Actinopolyspora halophila TaxID=1850 RepID=UPI00035C67FD|nr:hypothetical protein [Actinopolyspora halophila]